MADNNSRTMNSNNPNNPNQTIKAEQAKAEMSGRQHEKAQKDDERRESSAIGGGQSGSQSKTGEQGRSRDEVGGDQGSVTPR